MSCLLSGRRIVLSPFVKIVWFAFFLHVVADDGDHFADFSHGTLKVLHHVHNNYLLGGCAGLLRGDGFLTVGSG